MGNSSVKIAPVDVTAEEKEGRLRALMHEMQSVLVAYSGGVDSSYLALIATQELGAKALCVTGISASLAAEEKELTEKIAADFGLHHETVFTDELANPDYQANAPNRCYFCKSELYGKLSPVAAERGFAYIVDGSTTDDLSDFRPGRQAAREKNVRSPLIEAGLSKAEVRVLSQRQNLPTWDKPASPCLSSRIAYGIPVTIERLSKVERGEAIVREMGFKVFRVRYHGELVRLEISPDEMERVLQKATVDRLAQRFRALGFRYVTLDLHGFRSGAMNEILEKKSK
jgi:pyridinium-3,5-biscarboxylic acid mononucleotide sulfurtransferase